MRKYTRKIHIQRLRQMLKRDEPCKCCPATKEFTIRFTKLPWEQNNNEGLTPCQVCRRFVGVAGGNGCPCYTLGKKKAIEQTLAALEAEDA